MSNEQQPTPEMSQLLERLQQLPALSPVVQEVIACFNDPGLDGAALAAKIAKDPALTSKLLRVANSSFYGFSRQIRSLTDAVVVMGLSGVRTLALSSGLVSAFKMSHGGVLDRSDYWKRSFGVATYAKHLSGAFRQKPDVAFTAGIVHDVGLLVLEVCQPQQLAAALDLSRQTGQSLISAEEAVLGFNHAAAGGLLAQRWNFPEEIEHVIRYCHQPSQAPDAPLVGLISAAMLLQSGADSIAAFEATDSRLRAALHLTPESFSVSIPDMQSIDEAVSMLLNA